MCGCCCNVFEGTCALACNGSWSCRVAGAKFIQLGINHGVLKCDIWVMVHWLDYAAAQGQGVAASSESRLQMYKAVQKL